MRFQRLYTSLSQVVNIDLRGIGLSDFAPLDSCFSPEARATDILAVLDALDVERAVITGEGFSGHAAALGRAAWSSDIRELVARITVPTLVYYTEDLTHIGVEHSRYLAEHIPGAILVEAPGHSFYLSAETERMSAWAEFIVGGPAALSHDNKLLTLLFTDIVGSTKQAAELGDSRWTSIVADLDAYVSQCVERCAGRVVKQTGDGHLIAFELPRDALRAACEISSGVHVLGVEVRCGVHTGEVELLPDGDLRGIAVHAAARVCDAAGAQRVLVSRTVADLAAGSDFRFEDRGVHELKGVSGAWTLYEVLE